MKYIYTLFILFIACEVPKSDILYSDQLTVEGFITKDNFAEVFLTNSLPFSGVIDSIEVVKSIERNAKVELSNGEISEILTLKKDESRFPFFYYRSNDIKGEIGKDYNLSVTIRQKTFTSTTTLPEMPEILSVDFQQSIDEGVVEDNYRDIKLTINKNALSLEYYKVLIKNVNEAKYQLASPFIVSTENISSKSFSLIITYFEYNDNGIRENKLGVNEVIELKLVAITKEQYDFWKSIKGDQSTLIENAGFTNEVVTNISNGAFGYWSGEAIDYIKFRIPVN